MAIIRSQIVNGKMLTVIRVEAEESWNNIHYGGYSIQPTVQADAIRYFLGNFLTLNGRRGQVEDIDTYSPYRLAYASHKTFKGIWKRKTSGGVLFGFLIKGCFLAYSEYSLFYKIFKGEITSSIVHSTRDCYNAHINRMQAEVRH